MVSFLDNVAHVYMVEVNKCDVSTEKMESVKNILILSNNYI